MMEAHTCVDDIIHIVITNRWIKPRDVLSLATINYQFAGIVKPFISSNFIFIWPLDSDFSFYSPKNVIITPDVPPHRLPNYVTKIIFHEDCCTVYEFLPQKLEIIHPPFSFNLNTDLLPSSLQKLPLEDMDFFDSPVDNLPPNLKLFQLPYEFSYPVDYLPPHLTQLSLSANFDHALDNLPSSLLRLSIYGYFNHPLDHLPSSLKELTVFR